MEIINLNFINMTTRINELKTLKKRSCKYKYKFNGRVNVIQM